MISKTGEKSTIIYILEVRRNIYNIFFFIVTAQLIILIKVKILSAVENSIVIQPSPNLSIRLHNMTTVNTYS